MGYNPIVGTNLNAPHEAGGQLSAVAILEVRRVHDGLACAGTFARWTNQTQEARVYYHDGPIRRRKRGYILTTEQSEGDLDDQRGLNGLELPTLVAVRQPVVHKCVG